MSRSLRTKLPVSIHKLKPKVVRFADHQKVAQYKKNQYKHYYDKHARPLSDVRTGDDVYFRLKPDSHWQPGVISRLTDTPRSYIVKSPSGAEYRRNRAHILKPSPPVLQRSQLFDEQPQPSSGSLSSEESQLNCSDKTISNEEIVENKSGNVSDIITNENRHETTADNEPYYRTRSGRSVKPTRRFSFD